ncbi:LAGLIDADG family homing endonuclease [Thermococcus sp.]
MVDREFAEAFAGALKRIGLNPRRGFEKDKTRSGRWYVEVSSKSLFTFLKGPKEKLFEVANAYPREFLRGFFDSEGSAIVSRRKARVEACNYDFDVLKLCQELLAGLGIHSKIYKTKRKGQPVVIRGKQYRYNSDLFTLTIYRRESVYRYTRNIGFTIPRKQDKLLEYLGLSQHNDRNSGEDKTERS